MLQAGGSADLAGPPEGGEGFGLVAAPSPPPQLVEQQRAAS